MHARNLLVALALTLAAPVLAAEPTPPVRPRQPPSAAEAAARHREKLSPFQVLVGNWRGDGWVDMGPHAGGRKTFQLKETVQPHLDGTVLVVEGLGTSRASPTAPEVPTHQALGVLSWDEAAGRVRFSAYRFGGGVVDTEMKLLGDGVFQWGFDMPQGRVRFTLDVRDGVWVEKGELSLDGGKTFGQFLEMTVRRAK
ncbi:hypothetical protein FJV41_30205 [Myxococcus llanfairpwllgwyngyllgogerychwyrndrobwllllantysiliogogogochensis]|uniref:DUF1579 domain-containing protein n=1 Tax=Myxococcus llanfairpwllgwyngyllgogerychwyrndrobwllllantysiliogogogochensis TaxID=2590453 RepID=A0A540WTD6_9BACT|nr:hypothetical protein [Myxococcus llanfairpwllgwyngyllgogerychwyrndrobwllllantysiliogogogochensis]TQF12200.1 hypothetical protein FJV41_30205 [Myxococcus llanfairpwllgwyngyllgogerychwyrndrobwllllantysiliogogogochensis]